MPKGIDLRDSSEYIRTAINADDAAGLVSSTREKGSLVQRALSFARLATAGAAGLTAEEPPEFTADPSVQTTTSGAAAVHLRQEYKSIPIFQAAQVVRFDPTGALSSSQGSTVSVPADAEIAPRVLVQEAVLKAAQYVAEPDDGEVDQFGQPVLQRAIDLSGFVPQIIASFPEIPERPTVLEAGPFAEPIKAKLVWFPLKTELRLAWEIVIALPDQQGAFRVIVDADSGKLLYAVQQMSLIGGRGNVHRLNGDARQMVTFPLPWDAYGLSIPADLQGGVPNDWIDAISTSGNVSNSHPEANGQPLQGTLQGGVVVFDPATENVNDQLTLNAFYYACFMHDFFYLLGFRENAGNFQQQNFGRGGIPGDRVDVRVFNRAIWQTANMSFPADGASPVLNLGLVTGTNRHTAMDAGVVFHEYTHGVTNRLVGGPLNDQALEQAQSKGMGEGWSDYFACVITNSNVIGAWIVNNPAGLRAFPYDSNFPDDFGDVGTGRYTEPHAIGEIWCAALLEINRQIGTGLGVQLVTDALRLSIANPSFLDMRDAILAALDAKQIAGQVSVNEYGQLHATIWNVFAKFGMGANAQSNGASLSGIVPDFASPLSAVGPVIDNIVPTTVTAGGRRFALIVNGNNFNNTSFIRWNGAARPTTLITPQRLVNLIAATEITAAGSISISVANPSSSGNSSSNSVNLTVTAATAVSTARTVDVDTVVNLPIPDKDPVGVTSTVSVTQSGTIQRISMSVDIQHPFIGDLRVILTAPSGATAILHDRTGFNAQNLIHTYTSDDTQPLSALVGSPTQGIWKLNVADLLRLSQGTLRRWRLQIQ